MRMSVASIHEFWGKARPEVQAGPAWHPLPLHALDVAAVGAALLKQSGSPARSLNRLLGWSLDETVCVIAYLLGLHDIGKFARKFQAKAPNHFPSCLDADPSRLATAYDHGSGGLRLFDSDPISFLGSPEVDEIAWVPLFSAVFGHHGEPPASEATSNLRSDFGKAGIEAAQAFIAELRDLFQVDLADLQLNEERACRGSHVLAGIAVLADWIGSNQRRWFHYREPEIDLRKYWQDIQSVAATAVRESGVIAAVTSQRLAMWELIGSAAKASPMQDWARKTPLPSGPALYLIEDETGSGKTEAATMLVHRLMRSGLASGVYIALPTMATANAMFDRLAKTHRLLFAEGEVPSVALVHGARDLHEGFTAARLRGGRRESSYSDSDGAEDVTASTACADWIADDRRRAFLADVGVGTVDQALLAILPCRHQSLRLLGISQSVLVLDEVHAYDAYMGTEVERLLEFQAALGGSAILLSATLPVVVRQRLSLAFARGLGRPNAEVDVSMEYPLATIQAADIESSQPVSGMPGRGRALPVRFFDAPSEALEEVERAARAGKAVLYLRNTVDDVLETHEALKGRSVSSELFHARFALVDRLKIEAQVVASFGKESGPEWRDGRVLIATQVVEQSLDLDFDVLITDLAPIDLLIQRAGRLWRHERPCRNGNPELVVVSPEPSLNAGETWFSDAFPRAAYVYRDHARLWLTARCLKDVGVIESPGGLRSLIEAVYGADVDAEVPAGLQQYLFDSEGRAGAERGIAISNVLDVSMGYQRDGGAWDADIRTPTRLDDDPQQVVRLALERDGQVVPYAVDSEPDERWRAWRLSEVSVAKRHIEGELVPIDLQAASEDAKGEWGRYDTETVLVVLRADESTGLMTGTAEGANDREANVTYSKDRGLIVT